MSIEVKVWSDFVCPFCMIAEQPLSDAIQESGLDVRLVWMPFELRPYPTPTLRPEDAYLRTVWPRAVYPLAEKYGVSLSLPTVSPQPYTALAWEGYQFAKERGKGSAYYDRVLKAFFQEDKDIGSVEVLAGLAGDSGLDPVMFRQVLEQRRYRDAHRQALAQAQTLGITVVPTIMFGSRRFSGVQEADLLLQALRESAEVPSDGRGECSL